MRYLILALLLFALPAHAIGPMAIPTSGKRANYDVTTFEGAAITPWSSATYAAATDQAHSGTYSAKSTLTTPSLTRTMDTASGTLSLWVRHNLGVDVPMTVTVGATTVINAVAVTPLVWTKISGTSPAGSSQLVTISTTTNNGSQSIWLDDISVPIP